MAIKLNVIVCSTRPGRIGLPVARWFESAVKKDSRFEPRFVDLAEINLPIYDEPRHPAMQQYEHAHTKAWSEIVKSADAYAFVMPEYNYFPSASLINALTYVFKEWNYKAAGLVSYGGVSGGMRAVQAEKLMMTNFKIMPLPEQVLIPNFPQHLDAEKRFTPNELHDTSAKAMLDELARWAAALKTMRQA